MTDSIFARVRADTATMLGLQVDQLSFAESLRVDRVVALRIEIDRLQGAQAEGALIDIRRLVETTQLLEEILAGEEPDRPAYVLTRLKDEELTSLELLLSKAADQPSAVNTIDENTPQPPPEEDDRLAFAELRIDQLLQMNANQAAQIIALNDRIEPSRAVQVDRKATRKTTNPPARRSRPRNVRSILDDGRDWDAMFADGLLSGHKLAVYLNAKQAE